MKNDYIGFVPEAILNLTLERLDDSGEEEIWHIPNWLYILLICCVIILMLRRVPQRENFYNLYIKGFFKFELK